MRNLKFKYKILILPLIAGVLVLMILGLTKKGHKNNAELSSRVENGYFPALDMSRDLETYLEKIQRGLQDVTTASDMENLKETDQFRDAFMARIKAEKSNITLRPDDLNTLEVEFNAYYHLAREMSIALIEGRSDDTSMEKLKQMVSDYNRIREKLEEGTRIRQEEMAHFLGMAREEDTSRMTFFMWTTVFALLGMGMAALWMIKSLNNPLERLSRAALQISQGDLTETVDIQSNDELGQLASSFNVMMENLSRLIKGIRDAGFQISSSTLEIDEGARSQATGAAEQSSTVTEVSTTIAELSQTASRIAENAKDLTETAQETLTGMKEVKMNVDQVAKKNMALGEKSKSVGNITQLIDDMSERINLLALNASIEAARAGEAGRGFAVVASEVGKLAERSAESTSEIRQLISEIQSEMNATIMGVEETTKWTDKGLEMVGDTAQVIKQISIATQQQKSAAEQVVVAMSDMDKVTLSFAASTKQTAVSAVNLSELSTQLKSDISGFKLNNI